MSDLFPCPYRGEVIEQRNRKCRGVVDVYACSHPENTTQQATRYAAGACASQEPPSWNCTDCLIKKRIVQDAPARRKTKVAEMREAGAEFPRRLKTPSAPKTTIVINSETHGFGDALTMAWVSEGAKGHVPNLVHYATGMKRQLLEMFGQPVTDSPVGAVATFAAYKEEIALRGAPSRVEQRGRFLGVTAPPKRPQATIPEADMQWAKSLMAGSQNVILFPNTEWGSREWPPFYWLELQQRLVCDGVRVWFMGGNDDGRYEAEPNYLYGQTWARTAAMMMHAGCVVSNDSGPMHLAGTLDRPVIALLGPTTDRVCNWMPSVIPMSAPKSEISCSGCYYHAPFGKICEFGCLALCHIRPETVYETVMAVLNG